MTQAAVVERQEANPLRNITPFDEIILEIDDLYAEAANWADGSPIESQEQCDALDVLDKSLLDAAKRLEVLRIAEKKPLDDQIDAIQAKYNPYIQKDKGRVTLARQSLNPLRAAWKEAERQRKEAAAAKARAEAEDERRRAEEAMRASAGNLVMREAAEEQLATAKEAEKFANRQEKRATTGVGLRTSYDVAVADLNVAIRHYWAARKDQFEEFVLSLANEDVRRGSREIPGITVTEVKKAI